MDVHNIMAVLVGALNSPTRPPALWPLAFVRYPMRELRPTLNADGSISVRLALYGWEYKHRGPRPKSPPPVDPTAVQAVFNTAFPDGIIVTDVQDYATYIQIKIGGTSI